VAKSIKISALDASILLLAIFFGYISIHPFVAAVVGSSTGNFATIKIWKDILVSLLAVAVIVYGLVKETIRKKLFEDRLVWFTGLYTLLTLVIFVVGHTYANKSGFAGLIFNLRFIALFLIVRILMYSASLSKEKLIYIRSFLTKWVIVIATAVAIFGIVQTVILPSDFMTHLGYNGITTISPVSTVDDNMNVRRAFSTLNDANELGAYLIIPIMLGIERFMRTKKWQYLAGTLIMLMGLYLTHSRAAFIGLLVAGVIFSVPYLQGRLNRRTLILSGAGVISVLAILVFAASTHPSVRLAIFHSSSKDGSLVQGSTFDHYVATKDGIKDAVQHPFGRGVGQAGPAAFYNKSEKPRIAENYYVQIAQEVGFAGLLLFILSVAMGLMQVLSTKNAAYSMSFLAGFAGVAIVALFLHTWASDAVSYIAWGLLGIFLPAAMSQNKQRASSAARGHHAV
jgi:hypothetical protein